MASYRDEHLWTVNSSHVASFLVFRVILFYGANIMCEHIWVRTEKRSIEGTLFHMRFFLRDS